MIKFRDILQRSNEPAYPGKYSAILDGDSLNSTQIWSLTGSTNTERRANGYWTMAAAQMYQLFRLRYAQSYGTSGHKIAGMLADQATALNYCDTNTIDAVFTILGTNDVIDTGQAIATLKANYKTFISAYANLSHKPYVFVGLTMPRADWEGELEATRASYVTRLHQIRTAITEAVTELANNKIIIFDAWDDIVDPDVTNATTGLTYYPKSGYMNTDGIHLAVKGSYWVGRRCAEAVKSTPLWAAPLVLPNTLQASNANPTLTGTGGSASTGASGTVADNCRVTRGAGSNMTAVCSKETKTIFDISQTTQKVVLSGATAADEEFYFYIEYPEPNVDFDGTKGVEVLVPIRLSNIKGLQNVYLYGRVTMGSTYTNKDMAPVSTIYYWPEDVGDIELLLRLEPLLIPAGTSTRHQFMVRMVIDGTVPDSGLTINIGQCVLRQALP